MHLQLVNIAYFRPSPDWDLAKAKQHDWHELIYVEHGRYRVQTPHVQRELSPGQFMLYPAGTPHTPTASMDRTVTLYMLQWYSDLPATCPVKAAHGHDQQGRLLDLMAWAWHLSLSQPPPAHTEMLTTLCTTVAACAIDFARPPNPDEASSDLAIRRACGFIDANLARNVNLADVAHFMQKSPSQTIRLFKSQLGITPMKYVQQTRLRMAIRLLRSSRDPFEMIVEQTGLGSVAYASRLIKSATGQTPRTVRAG